MDHRCLHADPGDLGTRLGILPRRLSLFGCLVGLTPLPVVGSVAWTEIVFPVGMLVTGLFLVTHRIRRAER